MSEGRDELRQAQAGGARCSARRMTVSLTGCANSPCLNTVALRWLSSFVRHTGGVKPWRRPFQLEKGNMRTYKHVAVARKRASQGWNTLHLVATPSSRKGAALKSAQAGLTQERLPSTINKASRSSVLVPQLDSTLVRNSTKLFSQGSAAMRFMNPGAMYRNPVDCIVLICFRLSV